ncbi:hypothetical protein [Membranihabitans marinus]|uniref:hypothetical protein n=1 Tax=Membranihabitans marinus TaxID=1227546 RepID=UPI001F393347|nr:hypothetical protein [Membranihabitans marinus]
MKQTLGYREVIIRITFIIYKLTHPRHGGWLAHPQRGGSGSLVKGRFTIFDPSALLGHPR